jgi:hypothetical protein
MIYKLSNVPNYIAKHHSLPGETAILITLIPMSEENREYREYLEWLAEGNTPEPADEQN